MKKRIYEFKVYDLETVDGMEYAVQFLDFENIGGSGKTIEDAIKDAEENLEFFFEGLREEGKRIPSPKINREKETYSGKFVLRTSKTLHKELAERAKKEKISVNQLAVEALSRYLGSEKSSSDDILFSGSNYIEQFIKSIENIRTAGIVPTLKNSIEIDYSENGENLYKWGK